MLDLDTLINFAFFLSTALTILILLLPSQYIPPSASVTLNNATNQKPKPRIQILVLGDIGRSPRMQYHAISIAKRGGLVDIIGYYGT
ncbi:hypothetical protein PHISCL_09143 [Aspergillus sclerotialis]|uniref:Chitobiosyldiphosphodolichol beta-mannosyltransferase n=1 Tax=Aspergillus sclerotialis TaxID=2070753 RepID=A0A3A2ZGS6_9EURO|nr:hypothetical protein PHISCL_09143 [Aspergillus sclerotialis]